MKLILVDNIKHEKSAQFVWYEKYTQGKKQQQNIWNEHALYHEQVYKGRNNWNVEELCTIFERIYNNIRERQL